MISLSYACVDCALKTSRLDEAQEHANSTSHNLTINGRLTPNTVTVSSEAIEEAARKRVFEKEVMRRARDRGVLR